MKLGKIKSKLLNKEKLTSGEAEALSNESRHTKKKIQKWRKK